MSISDRQLLIHLRLDTLASGQARDSSSYGRHGTPVGRPAVVPDDQFGSALRLGGEDSIEVAEVPVVAGNPSPAHSITGWVRLEAYPRGRAWILLLGQAGPGAHHWLVNSDGSSQLGRWQGDHAKPTLPLKAWVHIATTFDGSAARCYIDGAPWGQPIPTAFDYSAWGLGLAKPGLAELRFAGQMAAVRVYARALGADEVRAVMAADQSVMASFRRGHPLAFSLHDGDAQPVLAIVDDPKGATMELVVKNTASQSIVLAPVDAASGKRQLALQFRPGALPADSLGQVGLAGPEGWSLQNPGQPARDGSVTFGLACKGGAEIKPEEQLAFTLLNVGADGRGGTRGTRVELRYGEMAYKGETTPLHGSRLQHISIINRRGQKHIPLHIGFVGSNTILSDGGTSSLRLRITNVSKQPIRLNPNTSDAPSTLIFSFDAQQPNSPPNDWALGPANQVRAVTVQADKWVPSNPTEEGQRIVRRLTTPTQVALGSGESVVATVSGLIGRTPSGHTHLYVHYENFPGYWDGHLALAIEMAPLVTRDVTLPGDAVEGRVGIGTSTPQAKLQVAGGAIMPSAGNAENAGIMFPKDPLPGSGDAAWIRYYARSGEATTLEIGTANDAEDHIALMPSAGNVGVNIKAPEGRLHVVHTNQDANGNALILGPTNQSNLRLGYHQNYSWVQSHGAKPLAINPLGNNVGVGVLVPDATLDIARGSGTSGTLVARGTQRSSHFNYSADEHTYIRGGKANSNVLINDSGGNVAIGAGDPQGHRLLVNGSARVAGLRVNSGYQFSRMQAGHAYLGSHSGGIKEVEIAFPERFGATPMAVVTVRSEGYYADTFAVTVKYIDLSLFKVNILRLDKASSGWGQNLRLDWIAWE